MFTYLETFAGTGIGGLALDSIGGSCIGFSEINPHATSNYLLNFPSRTNYGDITQLDVQSLPDFDVLIGGTPCTDISLASRTWWGKTKNEGLAGTQSHLFFNYVDILNQKQPKWFIFENVRQLLSTNNGADWLTVQEQLSQNYVIHYALLDTKDYGVPQTRRRIYIVGQHKSLGTFDFKFPVATPLLLKAQDLLDDVVEDKHFVTEKSAGYILAEGTKNFKSKPEIDLPIARPILATMHKWHRAGADNYYTSHPAPKGRIALRRITPREAARLQGIPDSYKIQLSTTQAYILVGNAMSFNVVKKVAECLKEHIQKEFKKDARNNS